MKINENETHKLLSFLYDTPLHPMKWAYVISLYDNMFNSQVNLLFGWQIDYAIKEGIIDLSPYATMN